MGSYTKENPSLKPLIYIHNCYLCSRKCLQIFYYPLIYKELDFTQSFNTYVMTSFQIGMAL